MNKKPRCELSGADGNVFALMAKVSACMRNNGLRYKVAEMQNKIFECKSYEEALNIIGEYVDIH